MEVWKVRAIFQLLFCVWLRSMACLGGNRESLQSVPHWFLWGERTIFPLMLLMMNWHWTTCAPVSRSAEFRLLPLRSQLPYIYQTAMFYRHWTASMNVRNKRVSECSWWAENCNFLDLQGKFFMFTLTCSPVYHRRYAKKHSRQKESVHLLIGD